MGQSLLSLLEKIPEQYQDIYGHPEYSLNSSRDCSQREKWVREIIHEIQEKTGRENLRVLDLGCAQGYYSFVAAELGCSVLGVDMLDINIQVCQALQEETKVSCEFRQETIQELIDSIEDHEYDVAFLFSVIHHVCNENGFIYARQILEKLLQKSDCIITEMAIKEEPLYWNQNLPSGYEEWFTNIRFFDELDFFETHLSDIKRPLIFASNKWCEADGCLYEIDDHKRSSYTGKPDEPSRNYYFCEKRKILVKLFRNAGQAVFDEMRNERDRLKELADVSFAPQLISFSEKGNRIVDVTAINHGTLLWECINKNEKLDYKTIFQDILNNLIELENRGCYHGDLRSWNICLDKNQHAFLIDFGSIMFTDEDIVAENQYGFNGVKISTKRAFISLVYDCLIGNTYPSIGKYYAYDLSLYYDFDRIPKSYADFIAKYLIKEKEIITFEHIKELYDKIIIQEESCAFSINELVQIQKSQSKAVYYEKASYTSGIPREVFYSADFGKNVRLSDLENRISCLNAQISDLEARISDTEARISDTEARITEQNNHNVIIAEWANTALFESRIAHLKQ